MASDVPAAGPPLLIVVSGPSGVGKDALLARLRERAPGFVQPVTQTTRPPRPGEVRGRDYLFVSAAEFARSLAAGELLEHAEVYGHQYGVPRAQLRDALAAGRDVVMRVDVRGAATLRTLLPGAVFVFLEPDTAGRLEQHLRERGHEDEAALRVRLAAAEAELAERVHFDHVVVNVEGALDRAVDALLAIVERERTRPGRKPVAV